MRKNVLLILILCTVILNACGLPSFKLDDSTLDSGIVDKTSLSGGSVKGDDSSTNSSNDSQDRVDDDPWKSPMADCIPESPYKSYISFLKEEISTYRDEMFFSDYITGDYKFTCCDLSGDGVPELVFIYHEEEKEKLIAFSYDSDEKVIYESLKRGFNSECDYISNNGFVLLYEYEDADGNRYCGKTEDDTCIQRIHVKLAGSIFDSSESMFIWVRDAGSSEYVSNTGDCSDGDLNCILELAADQVTLYESNTPEDIISYLEECDSSFENSFEEYKLSKQQGRGLFHNTNNTEYPDNEYKEAEVAYEAFINNETSVRCDLGIKAYETSFTYIYGDKYTLSGLSDLVYGKTIESRYIDCGSDGTQELLIIVNDEDDQSPDETLYVISFYEGHLYLRFVANSRTNSDTMLGDDGYIKTSGWSGAYTQAEREALLDSDLKYHEVYNLNMVMDDDFKWYIPEAYEKSYASEFFRLFRGNGG